MYQLSDLSNDLPRHPTKKPDKRKLSSVARIVIHTTDWVTTPGELAKYDVGPNHISSTGCPSITYNDLVGENVVYHTLPYDEVGWHVGVWNPGSIGVAMLYRCTDKDGKDSIAPSSGILTTCEQHAAQLCLKFGLLPENVVGHRELLGTGFIFSKGSKVLRKTCPGIKVDMDLFRKNVAKDMQRALSFAGHYSGPVDGIFGKNSKAALKAYLATGTHV